MPDFPYMRVVDVHLYMLLRPHDFDNPRHHARDVAVCVRRGKLDLYCEDRLLALVDPRVDHDLGVGGLCHYRELLEVATVLGLVDDALVCILVRYR